MSGRAAELAAELRDELPKLYPYADDVFRKRVARKHAALSELSALAAKYETMDSRYHELWHDERDRAEAAEAEAQKWRVLADDRLTLYQQSERGWREGNDELRAEAQKLRAALEQIATVEPGSEGTIYHETDGALRDAQTIARNALAAENGFWEERYKQEHKTRHAMEDTIAGLRGQLADEMGLTEQQRARAEAAEAENTRLRAALERWKDHFEEFAGPNQARAEIVRLAESEARLRAALEPFAQDAEAFDNAEGTYGDEPVFERRSSEHHWRFRIADVRRARDALAAAPNEDA
jgi:hypothetical protein